jgi:hypothetical protein
LSQRKATGGRDMGKIPKRTRRPLSLSEQIQRTAAFKRFKEENLEKLQDEVGAEAATRDDDEDSDFDPKARVLVRAFELTAEGREVWRRLTGYDQQIWRWFCWEIMFRSDTFFKWCNRNRLPPWPIFNLNYCPPRVHISPAMKMFGKFLSSASGKRAETRLQVNKYIWPDLYEKKAKRGLGVRNLMPPDDYKAPDYPSISELTPLEKALKAYDMHNSYHKGLMEITRLLFPQTKGQHPSHDEEANRCLQQVKRWIAKVGELIHLVDE